MENQLEVILKECSLTGVKADYIIQNFETCFALAAEWDAKAKTIVVTDPSQKADMELAREGRLLLRDKRIAIQAIGSTISYLERYTIEKSRVSMKADILKEGRAIDAVAGKLKDLITPIEAYLDAQEHFVEIQNKAKDDAHRAEIEKRMAEEDAAKAKAEAEEREKLRVENERLRKENAEKDRLANEEKARQEQLFAKERRERDAAIAKERAKVDAERRKAALAREVQEAKAENERVLAEEAKAKADAASRRKLAAEREEKERLEAELKAMIECPHCHKKFKLER